MLRSVAVERLLVVRPLSSPAILRHCSRCGADRPFVSSGCFRVNAQKRRLDVWLIRRCGICETTWNQRLHQRVTAEELGADLERYHHNDPALAAAVADDPERLAEAGGEVLPGEISAVLEPGPTPFVLRVALASPVVVRLDRVLCLGLGLSRSGLAARVERGVIEVDRRALARRVVDGACVLVHSDVLTTELRTAGRMAG